jgi:hypothetical protein
MDSTELGSQTAPPVEVQAIQRISPVLSPTTIDDKERARDGDKNVAGLRGVLSESKLLSEKADKHMKD